MEALPLPCGNPFDDPIDPINPRDPIVQEWGRNAKGPNDQMGLDIWRNLTTEQRDRLIDAEVEENGIVKPKGYKVSFHYNPRVEAHHFGKSHPMKPWRLTLTKQLIISYGLHFAMDLFESRQADMKELMEFHSEDYIKFLESIDPERHPGHRVDETKRAKYLGVVEPSPDCPIFDGMWNYFSLYSGATLEAASNLISEQSQIAVNWSGGLHHAHKKYGAGFCYINDIVLAIKQLLTIVPRVLYIDIDVHHGDGVEEAFFSTDRVVTLSFHKYAPEIGFFPGTGGMRDTGPKNPRNPGAHHALNVPLKDGINDMQWQELFSQIAEAVIDTYDPRAIVLQCGADSLGGDKLGSFNINIKAHGFCVEFIKSKCHDRPLLIIGGGGYTPRNVARCWTHETSICVEAKLKDVLPAHVPYRQAFMGEEKGGGLLYPTLDNLPGRMHPNLNSDAYLNSLVENIHEQLKYIKGSPSVQMQRIPSDYLRLREDYDARMMDEDDEAERNEAARRRKEKNVGGRGELRDP